MAYSKYVLAKSGAMRKDIVVWTEFPANWQYFFNQATMTPDSPGDVDKVLSVKGSAVRRGPGDPAPFQRAGGARIYVRYPKSKGSARPGYKIVVAEHDPLLGGYREKRVFAVGGALMDVWAYAKAKAKFQITLWGPNGWYEKIDAATGGTQAQQTVIHTP
jgi:hypothetical protein